MWRGEKRRERAKPTPMQESGYSTGKEALSMHVPIELIAIPMHVLNYQYPCMY